MRINVPRIRCHRMCKTRWVCRCLFALYVLSKQISNWDIRIERIEASENDVQMKIEWKKKKKKMKKKDLGFAHIFT